MCVCVCVCVRAHAQPLRYVQIFVTQWAAACQVALSMGFSRQQYWSKLPFPSLGDLPGPGIEPTSPEPPELADEFFTTASSTKPLENREIKCST